MKLKTFKIIMIFVIFFISFPFHYGYDMFPNTITSFLFPVNESIFEHIKLIFSAYLFSFIIEHFIIKNKNLKASWVITLTFNIIFFLIIYIPVYNVTNHSLPVTLTIYFISIAISQIVSYLILKSNKEFKLLNKYSYLIILIIFLILIYLTYNPINNSLFIDKENKKIGLNNLY